MKSEIVKVCGQNVEISLTSIGSRELAKGSKFLKYFNQTFLSLMHINIHLSRKKKIYNFRFQRRSKQW